MESDIVLPTNGVLKKWTNFVGGWQERYFEVSNGSLIYYRSKSDKSLGCRGSICLKSAIISPHEFDECEFMVTMGTDVTWYLKAENAQSKLLWMRSIVRESNDSDYSSTSTKSHSRNPSLSSVLLANEKNEDDPKLFTTRVAELEAYRTMCKDQMTSIERLLDQGGASCIVPQSTLLSVKATHLALLVNINHIIELVKTGKTTNTESVTIEHAVTSSLNTTISNKDVSRVKAVGTPVKATKESSTAVNPNEEKQRNGSIGGYASDDTTSTVMRRELDVTSDGDEFYDADEFDEDDHENDNDVVPRTATPSGDTEEEKKYMENGNQKEKEVEVDTPRFRLNGEPVTGNYDRILVNREHDIYETVDKLAVEQLKYALAGVEDNVWTLFAEDGAMRMYTREIEEGGLPVDPLKAVHSVKGVTALEFMHYFFEARYKTQWDHTLDGMKIVETVAPDTVVLHQKHKTVWPAAPRESLFVSHIRRVDELKRDGTHDLYIVCNTDVQRNDVPLSSSSAVRVGLTVSMICETIVKDAHLERQLTRDDITCNIIYVSQVHPGGWVPITALRHVYKKEYPKFLRTFTTFVQKNVQGKPVSI